ncbi:hypothetical protein E2605_07695 [Dysgonomonas capnocytophagoides]|uniref:Uncharacterized protein n=1 Tax=Dysgonomonas capnocytophagoides TaxID=45254 RepID=A0A4Y8L3F3_9BACT|nr:hypothetical protein [Dysgonomonas capnocytophagoides]TFD96694.1 hypothetical protein E2605_07695 [Dysgonomonas capnocytophagoides]
MKKENVFPTSQENYTTQRGTYNPDYMSSGLTKRELFAAMAMQGILANPERIGGKDQELTQYSVILADALINELNKQNETD